MCYSTEAIISKVYQPTVRQLLLAMSESEEIMPLSPDQLNDSDHAILEVLEEGRATPTLVRDTLQDRGRDLSRQYISERIKRLNEHDHLRNLKSSGVYELVDDPRDN